MFDFAWSEIVLIGAVALIAIGPKDMPAAIRTVSGMIKKARRMAAEFQTHVDEMVREADLGDVKKAFHDIRNFDVAGAMEKAVDPDRSLRDTFNSNPIATDYTKLPEPEPPLQEVLVGENAVMDPVPLADKTLTLPESEPAAPAFIPPGLLPPPPAPAPAVAASPPAFIPPNAIRP